MNRAAWAQAELLISITGLLALGTIVVDAARDRRMIAEVESRSAAIETARNLLARARVGQLVEAPSGWNISRQSLSDAELVTVRGAGIELSTLVPR